MTNEVEVREVFDNLERLLEQRNYKMMKPILEEMPEADIAEFLQK